MQRPPRGVRMSYRQTQLLGIAALALLTGVAYIPTMTAGYIWDDDAYLTRNPLIVAPDGLKKIWFSLDSPSQYFPLVYTMFRMEHAVWGMNPIGYHAVNIVLHILNALLIWLILSRLRMRGAWVAAAIWALHPVNVESVAWITERKNTLSTLFYLSAIIAWMRFADKEKWADYALALVLGALALFAKTTACTLPAALLLVVWLRGEKPSVPLDKGDRPPGRGGHSILDFGFWISDCRKTIDHQPSGERTREGENGGKGERESRTSNVEHRTPNAEHQTPFPHKPSTINHSAISHLAFRLLPFIAMGLAMGLVSIWWEQNHQGTKGPEFAFTSAERILIASRALWFHTGKLIWPTGLAFSYPRWHLDAGNPAQYVWLVLCIGAIIAVWRWRKALGRRPIAALIFFVAALSPTLGFISLYTFKYSFVADHYQYVASIGMIGLIGHFLTRWRSPLRYVLPVVVLAVLGGLTWRQTLIYKSEETLWLDTIAKNPNGTMAYNNLGLFLKNEGRLDEALVAYGEVLERRRRDPEALYNIAGVLIAQGYIEQAKMFLTKSLEFDPNFARSHANLAVILANEGKPREAIAHLEKAVAGAPKNREMRYNLAYLLADQGRVEEAIKHFEELVRLQPDMVEAQYQLGLNLIRLGRSKEAIPHLQEALRLAPDRTDIRDALDP